MSLFPHGIVLFSLIAGAVALLTAALLPKFLPRLTHIEPGHRAWWIGSTLALPLVLGAGGLMLAVGPCLRNLALGLRDECHLHGGVIGDLCLLNPPRATAATWVLALVCLAPLIVRVRQVTRAVFGTRRLLARLRPLAAEQDMGWWCIPGHTAFVAGWPEGKICVGEELRNALAPIALDAVLAHERTHLSRGDLRLRLLARLVAATHVPGVASALLGELDLALEQSCDVTASAHVGDPLIVAQALIDAARLRTNDAPCDAPAFAHGRIDRRVEALCKPSWTRPTPAIAGVVLFAIVVVGFTFDRQVHEAAETIVQLLGS